MRKQMRNICRWSWLSPSLTSEEEFLGHTWRIPSSGRGLVCAAERGPSIGAFGYLRPRLCSPSVYLYSLPPSPLLPPSPVPTSPPVTITFSCSLSLFVLISFSSYALMFYFKTFCRWDWIYALAVCKTFYFLYQLFFSTFNLHPGVKS